jgi:hypothetical protein
MQTNLSPSQVNNYRNYLYDKHIFLSKQLSRPYRLTVASDFVEYLNVSVNRESVSPEYLA